MRYLSADFIFPIVSAPVKGAVLLIREDGTIEELFPNKDLIPHEAKVEEYRGIICPGFVNSHCHLELSFLRGKIPEGKGLAGFIHDLLPSRAASEDTILEAAREADAEMVSNGIVVVGDIANTNATISVKSNSRIHYHSFIEIFDLIPENAERSFESGKNLLAEFTAADLHASIVPHAPYSVSPKLLNLINAFASENNSLLSIHNQESEGENEMFLVGKGKFLEGLNKISDAFHNWKATGFRSLPSTFVHLPKCNKIQFIHNTYSTEEDIHWAHLYSLFVWWCFCPNANLYIEKRLPDVPLFMKEAAKITVGTDSYASNKSLSILDELKSIHQHYPAVSLQEMLTWACLNGADFLGLNSQYGSFEKGKKPGVNLIGNVDLELRSLTNSSFVLPLV